MLPFYDWWVLRNGTWVYLGRMRGDDSFLFWAKLGLVEAAQLYCRVVS